MHILPAQLHLVWHLLGAVVIDQNFEILAGLGGEAGHLAKKEVARHRTVMVRHGDAEFRQRRHRMSFVIPDHSQLVAPDSRCTGCRQADPVKQQGPANAARVQPRLLRTPSWAIFSMVAT